MLAAETRARAIVAALDDLGGLAALVGPVVALELLVLSVRRALAHSRRPFGPNSFDFNVGFHTTFFVCVELGMIGLSG